MNRKVIAVILGAFFGIAVIASSCSKNQQPATTEKNAEKGTEEKAEKDKPSAFEQGKALRQQVMNAAKNEVPVNLNFDALPDIVLSVNGSEITKIIYWRILNNIKDGIERRGQTFSKNTYDSVKKNVIDSLVNSELLFTESKKNNITVGDSEVDVQFTLLHSQFGSEKEYQAFLSKKQVTTEQIKKDIYRGMAINKFLEENIVNNVTVSEDDAKKYYEENKEKYKRPELVEASHIILRIEKDADEAKVADTNKRMDEILAKVEAGGDFAKLAKEYSEGPSAPSGGELGLFPRGSMVKEFEDAAFALKVGEMSGIVRSSFGLHIIKVTDKKDAGIPEFGEMKEKLLSNL
ncbi:MAG: peptidylprolyl isomerase, partial [Nitrospinota bacterium]